MEITEELVDYYLAATFRTVADSSKGDMEAAAMALVGNDAKDLRKVRSGQIGVLKLIRSLAALGYHYALYRGKNNGDHSNLHPVGTDSGDIEDQNLGMDTGLVYSGARIKRIESSEHLTLFDDESVRKKLTAMSKWDAMFDDERNVATNAMSEVAENFLQLGKTYKVTVSIEEVNNGSD